MMRAGDRKQDINKCWPKWSEDKVNPDLLTQYGSYPSMKDLNKHLIPLY